LFYKFFLEYLTEFEEATQHLLPENYNAMTTLGKHSWSTPKRFKSPAEHALEVLPNGPWR
jgi:hypothetical protein